MNPEQRYETPSHPVGSSFAPPPPPKKRRKFFSKARSFLGTLLLFVAAPLIALSITAYGFQSYQVDGESMEPTLQNNDRLIVNKINKSWARFTDKHFIPLRGTIIVFNQVGLYDAAGNPERQLIKRVIGIPGDQVIINNGQVKIINKENPQGFLPDQLGNYKITGNQTSGNIDTTLKENEIFVLGDNRPNSADSRIFGPINADNIVGTLSMRIFPINNAENF